MGLLTVTLDAQEQAYLAELLKADLAETRVEARRTDTPALRDELHQRVGLVRGLLGKLGRDTPPAGEAPRP